MIPTLIILALLIAAYALGRADERLKQAENENFKRLDAILAELKRETPK